MAEVDTVTVKNRATKRRHEEDEKPWRNWERKSCLGVFLTIEIPCEGYTDLIVFLKDIKNDIHGILVEELGVRKALKFYLTICPQLSRCDPDGNETTATPYLCSLPSIVLESSDIREQIDEAGTRISELLSEHEGQGSGFTLDCILECQLNIATYEVIGGSTYTPLPKFIQRKNATVNIKSKDNKNFLYCLSYVRKPVVEHAQRPPKYTKDLNNFNVSGIKFPVTLNQIDNFEQKNPYFSLNMFKLDKKVDKEVKLIPLYTTPERDRKYHANLLQTGNNRNPHYVVISNMSRLLFEQTTVRNKMYICKYCITSFSKESGLETHKC